MVGVDIVVADEDVARAVCQPGDILVAATLEGRPSLAERGLGLGPGAVKQRELVDEDAPFGARTHVEVALVGGGLRRHPRQRLDAFVAQAREVKAPVDPLRVPPVVFQNSIHVFHAQIQIRAFLVIGHGDSLEVEPAIRIPILVVQRLVLADGEVLEVHEQKGTPIAHHDQAVPRADAGTRGARAVGELNGQPASGGCQRRRGTSSGQRQRQPGAQRRGAAPGADCQLRHGCAAARAAAVGEG
mmetsp:Transcript_174914/g.560865  ORF Transcript_174914/g.560865 Transcript_174914/m.560865 type:complete len:243 (+) Transcript_174914:425-1153(+)